MGMRMCTGNATHLVRQRPRDDVAGGAEARQQQNHQRVAHQRHLVVDHYDDVHVVVVCVREVNGTDSGADGTHARAHGPA